MLCTSDITHVDPSYTEQLSLLSEQSALSVLLFRNTGKVQTGVRHEITQML